MITSTGEVTVIAGTGEGGFSGDGGPSVEAALNYPTDVFVDQLGDIYVADNLNHRIRRIDAITGIITTIAGTGGREGYGGDGDLAVSARLNRPGSVFVDGSGDIFIADRNNYRIRKVDAITGKMSTVAGNGISGYSGDGGSPRDASFDSPYNIFVADTGSIYITDPAAGLIRKVEFSPPTLLLSETVLSFDQVPFLDLPAVGEKVTQSLTLNNTGDSSLHIMDISIDEPFDVTLSSSTIEGGGSLSVVVEYEPQIVGQHTSSLVIETNDPNNVTATVRVVGATLAARG